LAAPGCRLHPLDLEQPPLKADLTAPENLRYRIGVRRRLDAAALETALARVGASSWCERPVRTLSAGQRCRVALAGLALLGTDLRSLLVMRRGAIGKHWGHRLGKRGRC
jgi:ABC-type transport system involved in cytochrome c biogenesis ATPase subunit